MNEYLRQFYLLFMSVNFPKCYASGNKSISENFLIDYVIEILAEFETNLREAAHNAETGTAEHLFACPVALGDACHEHMRPFLAAESFHLLNQGRTYAFSQV